MSLTTSTWGTLNTVPNQGTFTPINDNIDLQVGQIAYVVTNEVTCVTINVASAVANLRNLGAMRNKFVADALAQGLDVTVLFMRVQYQLPVPPAPFPQPSAITKVRYEYVFRVNSVSRSATLTRGPGTFSILIGIAIIVIVVIIGVYVLTPVLVNAWQKVVGAPLAGPTGILNPNNPDGPLYPWLNSDSGILQGLSSAVADATQSSFTLIAIIAIVGVVIFIILLLAGSRFSASGHDVITPAMKEIGATSRQGAKLSYDAAKSGAKVGVNALT